MFFLVIEQCNASYLDKACASAGQIKSVDQVYAWLLRRRGNKHDGMMIWAQSELTLHIALLDDPHGDAM